MRRHAWRAVPAGPASVQVLADQLGERLAAVPTPAEVAGMCVGLRWP
ncbi:MAG: hypothetical protein R3F59_23145 [Myxococcota bacterium]